MPARDRDPWVQAVCLAAWLGWLGAPGCAANDPEQQLRAAREKIWATYGGKEGAACTQTGASQARLPTFVWNASAAASAGEVNFEGAAHDIDSQTADRLKAALLQQSQPLLACVTDLEKPARVEVALAATLSLGDAAFYGLDQPEVECLRAQLERALAGVDYGRTQRLRIAFGRSSQADDAAPSSAGQGGLSKSVIQDVIGDHIGEIRSCYESALDGWPDLTGRVRVKFIIMPDGSVGPAAVASTTLQHKPAECCITNTVKGWEFPPPDGGGIVVVTYPFVLEQTGE